MKRMPQNNIEYKHFGIYYSLMRWWIQFLFIVLEKALNDKKVIYKGYHLKVTFTIINKFNKQKWKSCVTI